MAQAPDRSDPCKLLGSKPDATLYGILIADFRFWKLDFIMSFYYIYFILQTGIYPG